MRFPCVVANTETSGRLPRPDKDPVSDFLNERRRSSTYFFAANPRIAGASSLNPSSSEVRTALSSLPRGDLGRGVLAVHRDARLRAERGVDVHELRARKRTLEGLEGDPERREDREAVHDLHPA